MAYSLIDRVLEQEFCSGSWMGEQLKFLETSEALTDFQRQHPEEGKEKQKLDLALGIPLQDSLRNRLNTLEVDLKGLAAFFL